ncbi:MAG: arsenate reductase (azurin) small subunit [Paracoccaceae bacterium]|nr:arsenate reductase (azurin) small subunit [Paracoccaceae bacterium]
MTDKTPKVSRRDILSIGAAAGLGAGLASLEPSPARAQTMPQTEVAKLADLAPGTALDFAYPDEDSPAILLAMGGPVEDGIGPNGNIVAFSTLCTHKGCPVGWQTDQQMLICPCHWSTFDPAKGGRMIIGQASQGLPQIVLKVEGDAVMATGVDGLIYGRQTNVL